VAFLRRGSGCPGCPRHWAASLLLVAGLLLGATAGRAQRELTEPEVKAGYLYNFTKFVEWPPEAFEGNGGPIRICVFGQDPFGRILDDLVRGETVNGHRLTVERPDQVQGLKSCHVLFISRSERGRLDDIFAGARGGSVLTVGETDGFLDKGGLINFVREGTKIRFEISERTTDGAFPRISSKLLRLAVNRPVEP
jgi:hypothetical protein